MTDSSNPSQEPPRQRATPITPKGIPAEIIAAKRADSPQMSKQTAAMVAARKAASITDEEIAANLEKAAKSARENTARRSGIAAVSSRSQNTNADQTVAAQEKPKTQAGSNEPGAAAKGLAYMLDRLGTNPAKGGKGL